MKKFLKKKTHEGIKTNFGTKVTGLVPRRSIWTHTPACASNWRFKNFKVMIMNSKLTESKLELLIMLSKDRLVTIENL